MTDAEPLLFESGWGELAPPAASESWAKPTEGGEERKTLYTFFWVV